MTGDDDRRGTLADRLQAGFESRPLTMHKPMPLPVARPPLPPWLRRFQKFSFVFAAVVAGGSFVLCTADLVGSAIWWRTVSHADCTVVSNAHHDTYGKSGYLGTVYDIDTANCGLLQVTGGGGGLDETEAEALGQSLLVGDTYRVDIRGWLGWPDERRAIVTARDLTVGQ